MFSESCLPAAWPCLAARRRSEHNFGKLLGEPQLVIRNLKQEAGEVTTVDGSPLDFGACQLEPASASPSAAASGCLS